MTRLVNKRLLILLAALVLVCGGMAALSGTFASSVNYNGPETEVIGDTFNVDLQYWNGKNYVSLLKGNDQPFSDSSLWCPGRSELVYLRLISEEKFPINAYLSLKVENNGFDDKLSYAVLEQDGEDGQNGADGKDGKDGITPKLKIENGKWYVSYDEGDTWTELGQATGDKGEQGEQGQPGTPGATGPQGPQGPAGADGADGDSFFKSVTQDENYVIFTLSDGTQISVLKASTVSSVKISYVPRYDDGKATVIYTSTADSKVEMDFQIMPKSAAAIIAKDWQTTLSLKAVSVITRAVEYIDMPISACTADATNGTITITASGKNLPAKFFKGEAKVRAALFYDTAIGGTVSEYIELLAEAIEPEVPATSNKEIHYTATAKVTPNKTDVFGANIVSNEWDSTTGKGVITFDADVTTIGKNAFYNCDYLKSITIPDSVTTIGDEAFHECRSLSSITIPDSVKTIGYYAFRDCHSLTSITIPDSVTTIGERAFSACGFTSITIPDSVTTIGDYAFEECWRLTTITIPDSVTEFGDLPFWACLGIKEFKGKFAADGGRCLIKDNTIIAYANASGTTYTIPDSVTTIGGYAFYRCSSLTSITIPDSVTEIGDSAFAGCISLPVENNIRYADTYAVEGVGKNLTSYRLKEGTRFIGYNAFGGCSSLTSITIPDSVTEIGSFAFSNCSSLTSVTIPDSVTTIGNQAFSDCKSLASVTIGDSVTTIGDWAFSSCRSLRSITMGDSVTTI